ncbi:MAG: hypothetical protein NTV06_02125, partial [candidate division Zixibacteria bacterium]|nr:hypothetical protein [candidate division Zixibacteria bacterium]
MLRRISFLLLVAYGISLITAVNLIADIQEVSEIVPGDVKANSAALSSINPSRVGTIANSVNLYTGQHGESFPLASIMGKAGLGVTLSLDYNGNVSQMAKLENRKGQASPFGLGFDIGMQSIVVDHKNTTRIDDDEYKLLVDNNLLELKHVDSNRYITEEGHPWIITRQTATIAGRESVIGWKIIHEDGIIYRFGDFSTSLTGWNATRNILRYGSFVGNGVTDDDTVYAFQWDLKLIQDHDSLNWIKFTYLQEQDSLIVMDSSDPPQLTRSHNNYTMASHISEIETSAGNKISISYGNRQDFQQVFGLNNYEFYFKKKAERIAIKGANGDTLSSLELTYSYLNSGRDSTLKKLILNKITTFNRSKSDSLPPLKFEYETDSSKSGFGSMKRICYPTGAIKTIGYKNIESEANYAKLDKELFNDWIGYEPTVMASDNMFIQMATSEDLNNYTVGYWNGYWKVDTFAITSYSKNRAAMLPNGKIVAYASDINRLVVRSWMKGYWNTDTLSDVVDTEGVFSNVWIYPGQDRFVVAIGKYQYNGLCNPDNNFFPGKLYYYLWDGNHWHGKKIFNFTYANWALASIQLRNDMCVVSLWRGQDRNFLYGRYDKTNDTLALISQFFQPGSECGSTVAGHDFVAHLSFDSLYLHRWTGSVWSDIVLGGGQANEIAALPNGVVWNKSNENGGWSVLESLFPKSGGFKSVYQYMPQDHSNGHMIKRLWASNHSLIAHYNSNSNPSSGPIVLYEWNGRYWQFNKYIYDQMNVYPAGQLNLNAFSYCAGPPRTPIECNGGVQINNTNVVGHFAGIWGTNQTIYNAGIGISEDYFGYCRVKDRSGNIVDSADWLETYNPFYYGATYHKSKIRDISLYGPVACYFSGFPNSFYVEDMSYASYSFAHRIYDTLFSGKPAYPVVDSVVVSSFAFDPKPAITKFSYFGGLLDEKGMTPRFAKATVSTPYYSGSSPDGYQVYRFYNDIDQTGFYDRSIYNYMSFPDLKSASRYGIANGGYHLDGQVYWTYSYKTGDPPFSKQNPSYFFHSLYPSPDSIYGVYRIKLDSVYTMDEGIEDTIRYKYDLYSGQVIKTIKSAGSGGKQLLDSTIYAFQSNSSIKNDNSLGLPKEQLTIVDSLGSRDTLSRALITYGRFGSWQPTAT